MNFRREMGDQLLREREAPEPYMNPTHERSLAELPEEKDSHLLQNRAHYAIASYLNGGTDIERVARIANRLGIEVNSDESRKGLCQAYRWLDAKLERGARTQQISIDYFDRNQYDDNELEAAICDINDHLEPVADLLKSAILHGSFGDLSYIKNYSDVDILLVVEWETLADARAVQRLKTAIDRVQREMYYVDPHQHHGVMVVTDLDLRTYNRAYLPPEALVDGAVLHGEDHLEFSIRDDELERTYALWRNVQRARTAVVDGQFPIGFDGSGHLQPDLSGHLYSFKYFTSFVMIQPSMYLLADGRPMYKSESFEAIPDLGTATEVLEACSTVRNRYPEYVSFDRSEATRRLLADEPMEARRNQPSTVPAPFREQLDGSPFENALEFIEQLWKRVI